jgi:hypothetical protein
MQICPALENFPHITREAYISSLESETEVSIMRGFFPPSSRVCGVKCFAAARYCDEMGAARTACVDYVVVLLGQESGRCRDSTCDDCEIV